MCWDPRKHPLCLAFPLELDTLGTPRVCQILLEPQLQPESGSTWSCCGTVPWLQFPLKFPYLLLCRSGGRSGGEAISCLCLRPPSLPAGASFMLCFLFPEVSSVWLPVGPNPFFGSGQAMWARGVRCLVPSLPPFFLPTASF